jgi:hypothetical protein
MIQKLELLPYGGFIGDSGAGRKTAAPRKVKRGSSAGEKGEKVSTIVSTRSLRPVAS